VPGPLPGSPEASGLLGAIISDLIRDLQAAGQRAARAYQEGLAEGVERGKRIGAQQEAAEMHAHWCQVARAVRASAQDTPYHERRRRQLEAARPKPGDYTGRLSPEEYFGTPVGQ
jgi:flagellar biosynthesis/type III secretory pathway protein FliH